MRQMALILIPQCLPDSVKTLHMLQAINNYLFFHYC